MQTYTHIVDNQHSSAADYLRAALADAERLSLVSAYFSVYGFEALRGVLRHLKEVRFLYGDRSSIEDVDPNQESKAFGLHDGQLSPSHALKQRALARECAEWVSDKGVQVRAVTRSNFMHGKMYLADGGDGEPKALVGSSNFTKSGLGRGSARNLEINLAVEDQQVLAELRQWFNEVWDEKYTEDVKEQLLAELNRVGANHSPRDVYYKMLYEIFRSEIESGEFGDLEQRIRTLSGTAIWEALYAFQKDGARSAIYRLQNYNGCILADSVGLGKTYTALAVIKYYELRNERVLVLCPKKLDENWLVYQAYRNDLNNPFQDDRFGFTVLSHSDLTRDSGQSNGVDLSTFNWSNFDLVVIDESHNFRNDTGRRYEKLTDAVLRQGANTKVLMLSATPVNTAITDLRNQIQLMAGGDLGRLAANPRLGVGNPRTVLDLAQAKFAQWEKSTAAGIRDKSVLIDSLGTDFKRLLDALSLSRSRSHVETYYAAEMERVGKFPERLNNVELSPATDTENKLEYDDLADDISRFTFALYQPWNYYTGASQRDRNYEQFLAGMMRTNFLKRLESSAHSLTLTLDRTIKKMDDMITRIERFQSGDRSNDTVAERDIDAEEDEALEDAHEGIHIGPRTLTFGEMNLDEWKSRIIDDRNALDAARVKVEPIAPERDAKLRELKLAIRHRFENPSYDKDKNPNRKLIVFTTFKDTATYLYDELLALAKHHDVHMGMVAGDETRSTVTHGAQRSMRFHDILNHFAPVARNSTARVSEDTEIDLLIATDCVSEGQNLQDCDRIINYDIHWNPVRITQRLGRIDRIGSRALEVGMINYWPTADMEQWLKLKRRVLARMAISDLTATGDDDPFGDDQPESKDANRLLTLRAEQFEAVRDHTVPLEDLDGSVSLGDFTLDHFRSQLLSFLEHNKARLEQMPLGVYAVTAHKDQERLTAPTKLQPGVIWCFRRTNSSATPGTVSPSEVFPFYLVYVTRIDGHVQIRFGCTKPVPILQLFDEACSDQLEPLQELCDQFDSETRLGRDMSVYDGLLTEALAHVQQEHQSSVWDQIRSTNNPGLLLPPASDTPNADEDLELVSWLVIKERAQQSETQDSAT